MRAVLTARIGLVTRRGQERIAAEKRVVIEILPPQGQAIQALGQELGERILDEAGVARVVKTRGQRAGNAQPVIDLAEQQHAAVAGKIAGGKIGDHFAGAQVGEKQGLFGTVCHAGSAGQYRAKPLVKRPSNTLSAGFFSVGCDLSGLGGEAYACTSRSKNFKRLRFFVRLAA